MSDKAIIKFNHKVENTIIPLNAIGATTSNLRTVPFNDEDNTAYVRWQDIPPVLGQIVTGSVSIPRSDGPGVNKWHWLIYGNDRLTSADPDDWVLFATIKDENGASAFVVGSALTKSPANVAWRQTRVVLQWISGDTSAIVGGDSIQINGFQFYVARENISTGSVTYYLGQSSNTFGGSDNYLYYDRALTFIAHDTGKSGAFDDPFRSIQPAYNNIGGSIVQVVIRDDSVYSERLSLNIAAGKIYADSPNLPVAKRTIGPSIYRRPTTWFSNAVAEFYNETGSDSTGDGTWQNPWFSPGQALASLGVKLYAVYGGAGASGVGTYAINGADLVIPVDKYLEPDRGYTPTLKFETDHTIQLGADWLKGFIVDGNGIARVCVTTSADSSIEDCEIKNPKESCIVVTASAPIFKQSISRCILHDVTAPVDFTGHLLILIATGNDATIDINDLIVYQSNNVSIFTTGILSRTTGGTADIRGVWENITIYSPGTTPQLDEAFTCVGTQLFHNTIRNMVIDNTYRGVTFGTGVAQSAPFSNLQISNIFVWAFQYSSNMTIDNVNQWNNGGNNGTATLTLNNALTSDPLYIDKPNNNYAISPLSESYNAGFNNDSIGLNDDILSVNEDDNILNGLTFDDISRGSAIAFYGNHALIVEWCTCKNMGGNGIKVGVYNTSVLQSLKNKFYNNGAAIADNGASGNLDNNLVYNNISVGVFLLGSNISLNHNTIANNGNGLYIPSTAIDPILINNIIAQNSVYDIFSGINLAPTYLLYKGDLTPNVSLLGAVIIQGNPFFINEALTGEDADYNLMSIANNNATDSPGLDVSSDSKDLGCFDVSRTFSDNGWDTIEFEQNPRVFEWKHDKKGLVTFEDVKGAYSSYKKATKRRFVLNWTAQQGFADSETWKILDYLSNKSEDLETSEEESIVKLLPLSLSPFIKTLNNVTIDPATGILSNITGLIYNELKGYELSLELDSNSNGNINATTKTILSAAAGWTVNAHAGVWVYTQKHIFYIVSNTADTLTVFDPYSILVTDTLQQFYIIKDFKVLSNARDTVTLDDEEGWLNLGLTGLTGVSFFQIYIDCKLLNSGFKMSQGGTRYDWNQEGWKNGFNLELEEK